MGLFHPCLHQYIAWLVKFCLIVRVVVRGCSPQGPSYVPPTTQQMIGYADVVVYGTVLKQIPDERFDYGGGTQAYTAEMAVHCVLKGPTRNWGAKFNVSEAGIIPGICNNKVLEKDKSYVVLTRHRDESGHYSHLDFATTEATPENLAAVGQACGLVAQLPVEHLGPPASPACPVPADDETCIWGGRGDRPGHEDPDVDPEHPQQECHEECKGGTGCDGPTAEDCSECKHFDNDGSCVAFCPPGVVYDPVTFQYTTNPDRKYVLGNTCVDKCPDDFYADRGACVGSCGENRAPDNEGICQTCPGGDCDNETYTQHGGDVGAVKGSGSGAIPVITYLTVAIYLLVTCTVIS